MRKEPGMNEHGNDDGITKKLVFHNHQGLKEQTFPVRYK